MSQIEAVLDRVRAVAFKGGLARLSEEAGVPERTLRRFLKKPPKQIETLKKLEAIIDAE